MKKKRPTKGSDLAGSAWAFATIDAARAVYTTVLETTNFLSDQHDCSLQTVFFGGQPILIFLWATQNVDPALVAEVKRLAVNAGGEALAVATQTELLRQAGLRWRVMRKPEGGTVIKHHPRGKPWTDLRD